MSVVLLIAVAAAAISIWGAAYLMSLWHDDRDELLARRPPVEPGWPFSRVLAYLGIVATLSSNLVGAVALLRLLEVPSFRDAQLALTPFTLASLLYLDLVFPLIALYLRSRRRRHDAGEEVPLDQASESLRGAEAEGLLEGEVGPDLERDA